MSVKILQGDCLTHMGGIKTESIHLTADEYLAAINEYFEALKELRKTESASS